MADKLPTTMSSRGYYNVLDEDDLSSDSDIGVPTQQSIKAYITTMNALITANTDKIDSESVDGLLGVKDSLAYKVHEIEKHLHSSGRWFGATAAAGVAPGLLTSLLPFKITADNAASTYGAAVEILDGSEDYDLTFTPVYMDPHQIFVTTVTNSGIFKVRLANSGWNGTADTYASMAAAIAAGAYTEFVIEVDSTKADAVSLPVQTGRMKVGSTLWAQVMHDDTGGETLSFMVGVHCYAG